jgi:catechol 2,3-dioxygenase-like lactoylglutathione lyase family enzyme
MTGVAAADPAQKITPPPGYGQKLSLGFTKFVVSDMDKAVKYYTAVGMREASRYQGPDFFEVNMKFDGAAEPILVLQKYSDDRKIEVGTAYGNLGILTPDIKGLFARLDAIGFKATVPPHEMPQDGVIVGLVKDFDGRQLEIVEMMRK